MHRLLPAPTPGLVPEASARSTRSRPRSPTSCERIDAVVAARRRCTDRCGTSRCSVSARARPGAAGRADAGDTGRRSGRARGMERPGASVPRRTAASSCSSNVRSSPGGVRARDQRGDRRRRSSGCIPARSARSRRGRPDRSRPTTSRPPDCRVRRVRPCVLFIGRLEPRKGIDAFLAAPRSLLAEHDDSRSSSPVTTAGLGRRDALPASGGQRWRPRRRPAAFRGMVDDAELSDADRRVDGGRDAEPVRVVRARRGRGDDARSRRSSRRTSADWPRWSTTGTPVCWCRSTTADVLAAAIVDWSPTRSWRRPIGERGSSALRGSRSTADRRGGATRGTC